MSSLQVIFQYLGSAPGVVMEMERVQRPNSALRMFQLSYHCFRAWAFFFLDAKP